MIAPAPSVFDCHQHYGRLYMDPAAADPQDDDWATREIDSRLSAMEQLGVERALVMPANDYPSAEGIVDTRRVNDGLRAYIDQHPARFPGGIGVAEPRHGMRGLDEIRRCVEELHLLGVQYHCRFQGIPTDHPWMFRHLEVLEEMNAIAFIHSHADSKFESTLALGNLASSFPDLRIVVLDAFSGHHHSLECLDLAERCTNLRFDTAMAYNLLPLQEFVRRFGAERLLYGTDIYSYPLTFRTAHSPTAVQEAFGDDSAKILGGNLADLLER